MSWKDLKFLGRYEILEKIAVGGMAVVFLGRIQGAGGFEKKVAVKVLHEHLSFNRQFVDMLLDEARISGRLTHGNIASVIDVDYQDGIYFLVQEYFPGAALDSVLRTQTRLSLPQALYIASEILKGLYYAHTRLDDDGNLLKIVHRDISPANILLTDAGEVKILDFGIAKATHRLNVSTGDILKGKYRYMSPEQLSGGSVDHRSDLFSLAVIIYEMMTGKALFDGPSTYDIFHAILKGVTDQMPQAAKDKFPPEVWKILRRALETDPNRRYPDADAFRVALQKYMSERFPGFTHLQLISLLKKVSSSNEQMLDAEKTIVDIRDESLHINTVNIKKEPH